MTTQVDKTRPREVKRKLAAIFSADVKGYSRLMGEDEEWTLHSLNTYKGMMSGLFRQLHAEGTTILLVEQNARMALQVADRGYVLQSGAVVLSDQAENLRQNEMVGEAYLGET